MTKRIVYENEQGGVSVVTPAAGVSMQDVIARSVPPGVAYQVVDEADIPADRTFRAQWKLIDGKPQVDLAAAKEHAHAMRRAAREQEMAPLDAVIAKQIPGKSAAEAEEQRATLRGKYATVQEEVDAAGSVDMLLAVVRKYEL